MLRRIGGALSCAAMMMTVALSAIAPTAVAAPVPKAVDFWGMPPNYLAVRPGSLSWHTDLGPSFDGPTGSTTDANGPHSNLSWQSWTAAEATGTGFLWVPSAHGDSTHWTLYPASLHLAAPKVLRFSSWPPSKKHLRPVLVFTQITVSFTGAVPARWQRSASFKLKRIGVGMYGFAFPS